MTQPESKPLSREEVRNVDRRAIDEFAMSGIVLMENAGRGSAELLLARNVAGPIVICCGKGNNGGDGFVIARHLEAAGVPVEVLLFADPDEVSGDAAVNLRILQKAQTPLCVLSEINEAELAATLQSADWIVDALLGTGLTGEVRDPYRTIIETINAAGRPVLAVDLPSGMDCDTGQPLGVCVQAELTATFVARKRGFDCEGASERTGEVAVVSIGVPQRLLEE